MGKGSANQLFMNAQSAYQSPGLQACVAWMALAYTVSPDRTISRVAKSIYKSLTKAHLEDSQGVFIGHLAYYFLKSLSRITTATQDVVYGSK